MMNNLLYMEKYKTNKNPTLNLQALLNRILLPIINKLIKI
jgi:hypothetical protein